MRLTRYMKRLREKKRKKLGGEKVGGGKGGGGFVTVLNNLKWTYNE
jgi:hypothetical protein